MPNFFADFFDALYTMPLASAALWCLAENILIFGVTIVVGHFLIWRYQNQPVTETPPALTLIEVILAMSCILLNSLVTIVGIILWRAGLIQVRMSASLLEVLIDTVILFFAMDLAMYVFHRVAHHPLLFPLIHRTHHRFENPRPLTLFVLNPFEVLGFGGLWLLLLVIYPASWLGIIIYLTINIVFGLVGHLGVEPMPNRWINLPVIAYISTSTFHAEHHLDKDHNYGFYTLIWDRLFGTLTPSYNDDFQSAHEGIPIQVPKQD